MRKTFNLILFAIAISFISCSTNEDETNSQERILKANINGELIDFSETVHISDAILVNGKKLSIDQGYGNTHLSLTIGETFIEDPIREGKYLIGTPQDNLETNIWYSDSDDRETSSGIAHESYLGRYGCNVLNNTEIGEINITKLDTENKIVSGTFSGTLFRWIDVITGDTKIVEVTNGVFTLPYIEENKEINPDRNFISAKINGYRFMSEAANSPDSKRSTSSGLDIISVNGYDPNFGRMKINIPSNIESGNNYIKYNPDASLQSLGVIFQNRIDLTEDLLSNNPNQSNDSYISIINHDPEENIIEGSFYIENSEIDGRTITEGYFKTTYIDNVDK